MRRLAIAAVLLACLPAGVAAARQFVQEGTLRVAFDAQLLPHALPRERDGAGDRAAGRRDPHDGRQHARRSCARSRSR